MKTKIPDRLYVRKSDVEDFEMLNRKDSPFHNKPNKVIFIMAMILGFHNGKRIPLEKKKEYVRTYNLKDEENSLIKAIAVNEEGDLNILLDKQKVYSIAEEYAAGGIKYLKRTVFDKQYGSYLEKLESELVDEYKKLKLNNKK